MIVTSGAISLKRALRALYQEIAEFRFEYALVTVPEAGPRESLQFYWYKYRNPPRFRSVLRLDSNGIARVWGRTTGVVYRPAFVAMYGLTNRGDYLRNGSHSHLRTFLNQVNWLEQHAVIRSDGAVVWPQAFDVQEGPVILKAPWLSANVQGFVISALGRGWRIARRPSLLQLLKCSARVFQLDCESKGVRVKAEEHVVYTQIPGLPDPGIMDGFMTSLLGLYELYVETSDPEVYNLCKQGTERLRYFLPRWDYRKKWVLDSNGAIRVPPGHHCLNRVLLAALARLTGGSCFADYAKNWNPTRLSQLNRAEIYLMFVLTKNACRLKHRTRRRKPVIPNRLPSASPFAVAPSTMRMRGTTRHG